LKGLVARLRQRLEGTRRAFFRIRNLLTSGKERLDELEELLIGADIGVGLACQIIDRLSAAPVGEWENVLREELLHAFSTQERSLHLFGKPAYIMVVGVNGSGKTTTACKLAKMLKDEGKKVLLVAGDTFRAASIEQLTLMADKAGIDLIKQDYGADPAAVCFDAMEAARQRGYDALVIDTAGRLHTQHNLMEELRKIRRVLAKFQEKGEILLVLDGFVGQNGIVQARQFKDALEVTGLVVAKLDGTAKGGIVIPIEKELNLPVKFIGIGEGLDDLVPFNPEEFVDALLGD